MSNQNTTAGFYNLPAQSITVTTETTLLTPAASGVYAGLPSPALPLSTTAAPFGWYIGFPPDITGNDTYDGHPFKVRVAGKVFTGASSTLIVKLYEVPAATITAGTQSTIGGDHLVFTSPTITAFTGAGSFVYEAEFIWDSTSKALNGQTTVNLSNGTFTALAGTSALASLGVGDLNFIPSFTFGTANAGNFVQLTEFVIDRA